MVELSTSQAILSTTTTNEFDYTKSSNGCTTTALPTQHHNIKSDITQDRLNQPSRSVVAVKATATAAAAAVLGEAVVPTSAVTPAQVDSSPDSYELRVAVSVVSTNYTTITLPVPLTTPTTTSSNSPSIPGQVSDTLGRKEHTDNFGPEIDQNKSAANLLSQTPKQQHEQTITFQQHHDSLTPSYTSQPSTSTGGYQLRALKSDKSTVGEDNLWSKNIDVPSLSIDLIDETLNYFVNCRHRLSQITKTFDDSDAYILLLQEKEMDLELVARIGQDLLKQFNEVKDSNESLKEELARFHELNEKLKNELAKCQEDNQQLRYELASKVSLLDTFMEEEEDQLEHQDTATTNNRSDGNEEEFTSLRSQSDRVTSTNENTLYKRLCDLQDELLAKEEVLFKQNLMQQERNYQLEVQLRESESRLSGLEAENETLRDNQKELYEEIKTYSRNFAELLRIFSESQRESRVHDIGNISFDSLTEPPPPPFDSQLNSTIFLENPHYDTQQYHHQQQQPHHHHPQMARPLVRDSNSMVMSSSLHEELQESLSKTDNLSMMEHEDDDDLNRDDVNNEAEDEGDASDGHEMRRKASPLSSPSRHHRSYYNQTRLHSNHYHLSSQNLNKEQRRQLVHDSDSGGVSDGADSGMHTTNISTSTTPINNGLNLDTDSDLDAATSGTSPPELQNGGRPKNWLGLSTFTLTTLLLICLSATLNNTTNSNLAQKLQQIKFNR